MQEYYCPFCGYDEFIVKAECDNLRYRSGEDIFILPCVVPVNTCDDCKQSWTDHAAEVVRDKIIQLHREGKWVYEKE